MLQDYRLIRHYQALTDALVDFYRRGYNPADLRLLVDGYLLSLRTAGVLEPYEIHRIEEDVVRFMMDPSNFSDPDEQLEPQLLRGY